MVLLCGCIVAVVAVILDTQWLRASCHQFPWTCLRPPTARRLYMLRWVRQRSGH